MMKIYTYLSLPGLFIHELSHIIFGFLCGYNFNFKESFITKNIDGSFQVGLVAKRDKKTIFQNFMVSMSPLYVILAVAILAFFNPVFIIILIYFIATYVYSFPSREDFIFVRYAKVFAKYEYNHPVLVRFMEFKNEYKGASNEIIEDGFVIEAP